MTELRVAAAVALLRAAGTKVGATTALIRALRRTLTAWAAQPRQHPDLPDTVIWQADIHQLSFATYDHFVTLLVHLEEHGRPCWYLFPEAELETALGDEAQRLVDTNWYEAILIAKQPPTEPRMRAVRP